MGRNAGSSHHLFYSSGTLLYVSTTTIKQGGQIMKSKLISSLFAFILFQGVVRSQTIDELFAIAADSNRDHRVQWRSAGGRSVV